MNNQEWFNESLLSTPTENFVEVDGAKKRRTIEIPVI